AAPSARRQRASDSRRHPDAAALAVEHVAESGENLAHLRRLVGIDLDAIHRMDDHGDVCLEDEETAVAALAAVDAEIVEPDARRDRLECGAMAAREVAVEVAHELRFLG